MPIRYPDDTQRITVIGKTGSGKTQAAMWLLSHRSFDKKPWFIMDFKLEGMFNDIPGLKEHELGDKLPKKAGLYIVRPIPGEEEKIEQFFWDVWAKERTGLYVDEGYRLDKRSKAFQAILTQGRSKKIPVIMLVQRPVEVSRFCFSEADFIQCFKLTDSRDQKTVQEFMPLPLERPLPPYHSYWWDNGKDYKAVLRPVPDRDTIIGTFHDRLGAKRKVI